MLEQGSSFFKLLQKSYSRASIIWPSEPRLSGIVKKGVGLPAAQVRPLRKGCVF